MKFKKKENNQIICHHDNAMKHISARTTECLTSQNLELMGNALYSPDLVSNVYFVSSHNKLRGQRFSTPEDVVEVFQTLVLELSQY